MQKIFKKRSRIFLVILFQKQKIPGIMLTKVQKLRSNFLLFGLLQEKLRVHFMIVFARIKQEI